MTTLLLLRTTDHQSALIETVDTIVSSPEPVYLIRPDETVPVARLRLDDRVRARGLLCATTAPTADTTVDALVRYAETVDADRICIEIRDHTPTGKARVDDFVQGLLLHNDITGKLSVYDHTFVFAELAYA